MIDAVPTTGLNAITLFMNADYVVKGIMLVLAGASLWSWAVIIDRATRFNKLRRDADRFENELASGRSLEDLAVQAGEDPTHPLQKLLVSTLSEWRQVKSQPLNEAQAGLLLGRIDRQADTVIAREAEEMEQGLGLLSVVATASPFIGLFGTVWGIMHAFEGIAAAGDTSLATVAPAISEALFATAMGLGAAIPAYMAYNKFTLDVGKMSQRLESFAEELSSAVSKRVSDKLGAFNGRAA